MTASYRCQSFYWHWSSWRTLQADDQGDDDSVLVDNDIYYDKYDGSDRDDDDNEVW